MGYNSISLYTELDKTELAAEAWIILRKKCDLEFHLRPQTQTYEEFVTCLPHHTSAMPNTSLPLTNLYATNMPLHNPKRHNRNEDVIPTSIATVTAIPQAPIDSDPELKEPNEEVKERNEEVREREVEMKRAEDEREETRIEIDKEEIVRTERNSPPSALSNDFETAQNTDKAMTHTNAQTECTVSEEENTREWRGLPSAPSNKHNTAQNTDEDAEQHHGLDIDIICPTSAKYKGTHQHHATIESSAISYSSLPLTSYEHKKPTRRERERCHKTPNGKTCH